MIIKTTWMKLSNFKNLKRLRMTKINTWQRPFWNNRSKKIMKGNLILNNIGEVDLEVNLLLGQKKQKKLWYTNNWKKSKKNKLLNQIWFRKLLVTPKVVFLTEIEKYIWKSITWTMPTEKSSHRPLTNQKNKKL